MEKSTDEIVLTAGKPSAGRPRADEVEARHQNLMDTATHLFLKHGYSGVSLEMIARQAHVAVRTIYVKFGGKAGLFKEVLQANREKFYTERSMETDTRPLREIITDFGMHFLEMITAPAALHVQRMVIAEARSNPELAQAFFDGGPRQTREMLLRFFSRPDIQCQLRNDVTPALVAVHLLNCVMADQFTRFLFDPVIVPPDDTLRALEQRLALFFRAVMRDG